ncbi:hypothetical protein DO97_21205 [Neosynechococcus sphagnicola sy1]|uniref:Metal-binding protein n=1 Tax=Neosynechococcus sphagnicola sy1 TaxID=1497020 RepID=A0A098TLZ1_9CYAN|nr:YceD family protein [Neosynechococcus sphagnicola]KGF73330.1 hypothetical protein DO97_21205 [Neosynechococcus sphagnicola sy1]
MDAIFIPQLTKAPERTALMQFQTCFPELETLTPVQGELRVTHQVSYLEVAVQATAIVTLTCDRCLQRYNHRLSLKTSELIWLEEPPNPAELPLEREVASEDLVESLSPQGWFHPMEWLYQQLCLALPLRQLCDRQCPGIQLADSNAEAAVAPVDRRWASLEALKRQLSS